jgi:hypothetical protein
MIVSMTLEERFAYHNAPHWYATWREYAASEPLHLRTAADRLTLRRAYINGKRALRGVSRKRPVSVGEAKSAVTSN